MGIQVNGYSIHQYVVYQSPSEVEYQLLGGIVHCLLSEVEYWSTYCKSFYGGLGLVWRAARARVAGSSFAPSSDPRATSVLLYRIEGYQSPPFSHINELGYCGIDVPVPE